MKKVVLMGLLLITLKVQAQKFANMATTPPMGWNSWNAFATNINEQLVKETADKMVSSGMRNAGYKYLVLDDGWMAMQRDSKGFLVPDPKKFPHGMKALVAYVHAKGLKFGLYNCAGTETCAGYPGTRGYEYQDALRYAQWGIDYLKFDWCNSGGINAEEAYTTMSKALKKAGRPIVFSLCEWGDNKPWLWAKNVGELWRTTGDIFGCWDCAENKGAWYAWGAMQIMDKQESLYPYAGPGHWNDPDMLEVGNGMSEAEDRSHFSMWCMMAAPLIAGNDIRKMSGQTLGILTNKNVIAIDQDSLGMQGYRYKRLADSVEVWVKPLAKKNWAVAFLNRSHKGQSIYYNWQKEIVNDTVHHRILDATIHKYSIKNVWSDKVIGNTQQTMSSIVAPHDVLLLRLNY